VAEWQTRWLQVPVFERMWGFKSPLAHRETPAQLGSFRVCARVAAPDSVTPGSNRDTPSMRGDHIPHDDGRNQCLERRMALTRGTSVPTVVTGRPVTTRRGTGAAARSATNAWRRRRQVTARPDDESLGHRAGRRPASTVRLPAVAPSRCQGVRTRNRYQPDA